MKMFDSTPSLGKTLLQIEREISLQKSRSTMVVPGWRSSRFTQSPNSSGSICRRLIHMSILSAAAVPTDAAVAGRITARYHRLDNGRGTANS